MISKTHTLGPSAILCADWGKTDVDVRRDAIAALQSAHWVRVLGVTIENLVEAQANEDDFDACMTATALLRCTLEKLPLCLPYLDSARAEGGMLGTGCPS